MHKLSPPWQELYKVIKIPNSFQVVYEDQETEKITHTSNCKKFHEKLARVEEEAPPPGDAIHKQKKRVNQMHHQNKSSSRRRMTLFHFEDRVGGKTHAFDGPDRFLHWLQGEEDTSANICVEELLQEEEQEVRRLLTSFVKSWGWQSCLGDGRRGPFGILEIDVNIDF